MKGPRLHDLTIRAEVFLEWKGEIILDSKLAKVLREVEQRGSLLTACRTVGVPYARTWERLAKVEDMFGERLLEAKRGGPGGGGAKLTKLGKELIKLYLDAEAKLGDSFRTTSETSVMKKMPDLAVMGSNDPALDVLIGIFRTKKPDLDVEISWLGSAGGLAALMIGDAHIAGVHLLDPVTGKYNVPFLSRYWLEGRAVVVRGYQRELGLAFRPDTKVSGISDLLDRKLKLVNRNPGSGTRILLDHLLKQAALDRGIDPADVPRLVKNYDREVKTHVEVAKEIATGAADVGITVRYAAELYGLQFMRLVWEWYDLAVLKEVMRRETVREFLNLLTSKDFIQAIKRMRGYRITSETGNIVSE
ncbi:MAG: substrate-binding domain-containing protein [Nitrososphaerota archaeon]|nr:LysR family transcriptional regulator [Aigarchaeota archaeon]MDW8076998.1 substrate-binding domain-containing protein [Nitrososphaerota archaeon]